MRPHQQPRPPTQPTQPPVGLDLDRLGAWCAARDLAAPPLTAERLPGGQSNLTARIEGADGRTLVLRRAPLGRLEHGAHDVLREGRVLTALAGTGVPVPAVLGLEPDPDVTGAPFLAMAVAPGRVVRSAADLADLAPSVRSAAAEGLTGALAALHALDPDDIGLGDLASRSPHVPRLLRRWAGQLAEAREAERAVLERGRDALAAAAPASGPARLVHGDYRLDNVVVDPGSGRVTAVLDWELATLGDALTDLGTLLTSWTEPRDPVAPFPDPASLAEGMPDRTALVAAYAAATSRHGGAAPDDATVRFHTALAHWKLACIAEGVHRRRAAGQYGSPEVADIGVLVLPLAERALDLLDG
jgi:aminoglycoside phosphotransferase (APT) family kinase protein